MQRSLCARGAGCSGRVAPVAASHSVGIAHGVARPASRRAVIVQAAKQAKKPVAKGFGAPKPAKGPQPEDPCPCGSGNLFDACCAPYHRGEAAAASPEALLRSRYSAYVAKDPEYIANTTAPDSPEYTGSRSSYITTVKATMRQLDPLGLTIVSGPEPGPAGPDEAFITFRLKRRIKDPNVPKNAPEVDEVTERSRFLRVNGRWVYVDSEFVQEDGEAGAGVGAVPGAGSGAMAPAAAKAEEPKKKGFLGLF
ncbi:hypothetical protein HYH03_010441 [Edaphochlamys debaryana]|uniref:YchJ-like middle NTF2-like domain-containing protein n=1 Tax=Edaphochlamys debaryana TaxID=47281 RepID=A0A836BXH5_9CHLO|nr:hypothetical protein HYH03_010441 [Edaphochlamys debaryana]|eukprot:KAG2491233.1 hypothetical protein HYH03_010441 [Edaphochlamys debaryana]